MYRVPCHTCTAQTKELELTNPSKKAISYSARLEGHRDFAIETSTIRVEPRSSAKLPLRCTPTNTLGQVGACVPSCVRAYVHACMGGERAEARGVSQCYPLLTLMCATPP